MSWNILKLKMWTNLVSLYSKIWTNNNWTIFSMWNEVAGASGEKDEVILERVC